MNFRPHVFASLFAVALATSACAKVQTSDIETEGHATPGIDKAALQTYGWYSGAAVTSTEHGDFNPPGFDVTSELKSLIDTELNHRGLTAVAETPDLLVAFLVINDTKELEKFELAEGVDKLNAVGDGALVIALVEATSGKAVFIGSASAKTESKYSDDETKQRLDFAVKRIFSHFKFQASK